MQVRRTFKFSSLALGGLAILCACQGVDGLSGSDPTENSNPTEETHELKPGGESQGETTMGSGGGSDSPSSAGGDLSDSTGTTSNNEAQVAGTCMTADVRTLFQSTCAQGVCHDSTAPAAGLDLSGADPGAVMAGVSATGCPDWDLLTPGDPNTSLVWLKLSQELPPCGVRMPLGMVLSGDQLGCVSEWITGLGAGAPDCETCGGDVCVDLAQDSAHCGACDNACEDGQVCEDGECLGCSDGETACGTSCVDIDSDPGNCGGCGIACNLGEQCVAGKCQCDGGSGVTFSGNIAPLLESNCTQRGCHSGRRPQANMDLTPAASYSALVGVPAEQCSDGRLRVTTGAPAESYLLNKLTGVDMCSGTLMPKADMALGQADIAQISAWICAGAQDN